MPTLEFDRANRLIVVPDTDDQVTVQEIYDQTREYEQKLISLDLDRIVSGAGKEYLGPGVSVGITITLYDWKLKFEDRVALPAVVCYVRGGYLVALDGAGNPVFPLEPSDYVMASLTSASSATLQELEAIRFASYQNGVWISVANGQSGTEYPTGTREFPVNNFADAMTIAGSIGLNTFYLMESMTCDGLDLDGLVLVGENIVATVLTLTGGCSTEGTEFREMSVTGALDGKTSLHHCRFVDTTGFLGEAHNCILDTSLGLAGSFGDIALFLDCWLGSSMVEGVTTIDMNGDGPTLNMRGHAGAIKIVNKTGDSKVAIDFLSGRIIIDSTVTAGTFYIRGVGEISENLGTGITVYDAPLTNPATVADQVWEELVAGHLTADTFGALMNFIYDVEGGRWKVENDQMIFYKADNVTELCRFNLKDAAGQPAMTDVMERERA